MRPRRQPGPDRRTGRRHGRWMSQPQVSRRPCRPNAASGGVFVCAPRRPPCRVARKRGIARPRAATTIHVSPGHDVHMPLRSRFVRWRLPLPACWPCCPSARRRRHPTVAALHRARAGHRRDEPDGRATGHCRGPGQCGLRHRGRPPWPRRLVRAGQRRRRPASSDGLFVTGASHRTHDRGRSSRARRVVERDPGAAPA